MRTNRMQFMRPGEIIEEKNRKSIVYLPIGPLEWHSYHLPFGTDALISEAAALGAADITGGVVMPTLFLGTERERAPETLDALGFEDTTQYIKGMDFPKNTMKSLYSREDVFGVTVREYLRLLTEQEYRLIVLVSGHAAKNQIALLTRLAAEFSNESRSKVLYFIPFISIAEDGSDIGHATILETAEMMAVCPDSVDISQLPPKGVPLKFTDFGMIDAGTGRPEKTVIGDPRDATEEMGRRYIENCVTKLAAEVTEEYKKLI